MLIDRRGEETVHIEKTGERQTKWRTVEEKNSTTSREQFATASWYEVTGTDLTDRVILKKNEKKQSFLYATRSAERLNLFIQITVCIGLNFCDRLLLVNFYAVKSCFVCQSLWRFMLFYIH